MFRDDFVDSDTHANVKLNEETIRKRGKEKHDKRGLEVT